MGGSRAALLGRVADRVPVARGRDCVRVAVDGVDGSGKTWFAEELAQVLGARGRDVVRVSADDWHQARSLRYARGRSSPEGFWLDSYDHARMRDEVLVPLGPLGSHRFRRRGHDLETDAVLEEPCEQAPPGAVLVMDGLFLQRAELAGCFELVVWLDVPFGVTAERMAKRDGTSSDPRDPSMDRYVGGQLLYFAERAPWARADVVVENSDVGAPVLVKG
jgi:uridine kinase